MRFYYSILRFIKLFGSRKVTSGQLNIFWHLICEKTRVLDPEGQSLMGNKTIFSVGNYRQIVDSNAYPNLILGVDGGVKEPLFCNTFLFVFLSLLFSKYSNPFSLKVDSVKGPILD